MDARTNTSMFLLTEPPALSRAQFSDTLEEVTAQALYIKISIYTFTACFQPCGKGITSLEPSLARDGLREALPQPSYSSLVQH